MLLLILNIFIYATNLKVPPFHECVQMPLISEWCMSINFHFEKPKVCYNKLPVVVINCS